MEYRAYVNEIMNQLNSVIVGKEDKVELVLLTLLAGGHLLLEDVPGVGKTTLANTLAKTIDCSFGRIQFTPDTLPSDVTGVSIYNMKSGTFEYVKGAVMNNIVLADEINRTSPKTQASLLEAMEEKQVTVDGVIYPLEAPFMVIATQNPIDFLGTYHLPEAQLDRFFMRISLGYPSAADEKRMAKRYLEGVYQHATRPVASKEVITSMQQEVSKIHIHEDIITYIITIVNGTREHESFSLGASPRATLAIIQGARAAAYLAKRDFVIPDDVQKVLYPVLCHRLVLSMEAKINKVSRESILKSIVGRLPVPILKNK